MSSDTVCIVGMSSSGWKWLYDGHAEGCEVWGLNQGNFAFGLVGQALGLLFLAAYQFAGFFLDFAADVFCCAFDLILVHGELLSVD